MQTMSFDSLPLPPIRTNDLGTMSPPHYSSLSDITSTLGTPTSSLRKSPSVVSLLGYKIDDDSFLYKFGKNFFVRTVFHILLGIALGTLLDKLIAKIKAEKPEDEKKAAWGRLILQMVVNMAIIGAVESFVPWLADDWMNTGAGLFFPGTYFSVQSNWFKDWHYVMNG